ncbi:MAG: hydroxyisourate hydrolase, partial [Alphaproteobacteria bacterium]
MERGRQRVRKREPACIRAGNRAIWQGSLREVQALGRLTTHVLDTGRGCPAAGVRLMLFRLSGNSRRKIAEAGTNADGRVDGALLEGRAFRPGQYEIVFQAGDYLRATGQPDRFLDRIPVRF